MRRALKLLAVLSWSCLVIAVPASQQPTPKTKAETRKPSPPAPKPCFNIGDTLTATGQVTGNHFTLYQPRAKGWCLHYPRQADRPSLRELETIGTRLPQGVYLEVKGTLVDQWPNMYTGIKVIAFQDVDAQIKTEITDWTRLCTEWQDRQLAIINKRIHGGNTMRTTDPFYQQCEVEAVDAQLPHEVIGPIRRR